MEKSFRWVLLSDSFLKNSSNSPTAPQVFGQPDSHKTAVLACKPSPTSDGLVLALVVGYEILMGVGLIVVRPSSGQLVMNKVIKGFLPLGSVFTPYLLRVQTVLVAAIF